MVINLWRLTSTILVSFQSQLSTTSPPTLPICLLCPLTMSSQISALILIRFHYEKVSPSLNSRSQWKWSCHFPCSCTAAKSNPWKAEWILLLIIIMQYTLWNRHLWTCHSISVQNYTVSSGCISKHPQSFNCYYHLSWIDFFSNHVEEIIFQIIIILMDHDKTITMLLLFHQLISVSFPTSNKPF